LLRGPGHQRVILAELLLINRKRSPVDPLGVRVLALVLVHDAQVVEGSRHIGVVRAARLLLDRQRALEPAL
jgi:hypothetical protein